MSWLSVWLSKCWAPYILCVAHYSVTVPYPFDAVENIVDLAVARPENQSIDASFLHICMVPPCSCDYCFLNSAINRKSSSSYKKNHITENEKKSDHRAAIVQLTFSSRHWKQPSVTLFKFRILYSVLFPWRLTAQFSAVAMWRHESEEVKKLKS